MEVSTEHHDATLLALEDEPKNQRFLLKLRLENQQTRTLCFEQYDFFGVIDFSAQDIPSQILILLVTMPTNISCENS